jgi:NUMOD1 domain
MNKEQLKKLQAELNSISEKKFSKLSDKQLEQYNSTEYKNGSKLGGLISGNKNKNQMREIQKIGCIIGGKKRQVPVFCFDKNGSFIKEYKSATQAANELKIYRADITAVCKGRGRVKTVGGFIWKYEK